MAISMFVSLVGLDNISAGMDNFPMSWMLAVFYPTFEVSSP
jgi:hypothetical protein